MSPMSKILWPPTLFLPSTRLLLLESPISYLLSHFSTGENTLILSANAGKITQVWVLGEYIPKSAVHMRKGELTGLAVHPTNSIFALSVDKTYSLYDLTIFNQIFRLAPSDAAFTSLAISLAKQFRD